MSVQVVSFNCVLKNKAGLLISSTFNREVITAVESQGSILSGLAQGLQKIKKGEKRSLELSAAEAYGSYDPKKVIFFPRNKIPKEKTLRCGDPLIIISKTGVKRTYQIVEIHADLLTLDSNHPLAGQDLVFEIEATDARAATDTEITDSKNLISTQYLN
ncbi:MAG: peptidylprolyl isomerase [Proteobacteria bacterium]|nr:MAG: peptidylprolyl isomerase [Pseudomonadota bacterium]